MPPEPGPPYVPDGSAPWDLRRVVHLHRRAGFGATWGEIRRDLTDGPEASVGRLLAGTCPVPTAVPEGFEATSTLLGQRGGRLAGPGAAQGLVVLSASPSGPDPLGERLTLALARPLRHEQRQGREPRRDPESERDLSPPRPRPVRRVARGPRSSEPALLAWLDAPANRKGHPEREPRPRADGAVHPGDRPLTASPTSEDAARALTGWSVDEGPIPGPCRPPRRRPEDDPRAGRGTGRATTSSRSSSTSPPPRTVWPRGSAERLPRRAGRRAIGGHLRPGGRPPVERIGHRPGGGHGAPLPGLLRPGEPGQPSRRTGRVRGRAGPGTRTPRPAAEHARPRRLGRQARAGPVLPAQRRRLDRAAEPGCPAAP